MGFDVKDAGYKDPAADGSNVEVVVKPDSQRLQLLDPSRVGREEHHRCRAAAEAKGKCTTDHISMAGPWLRYRGHLDNISNNTLTGAINAFNDTADKVKDQLSGEYGAVPDAAPLQGRGRAQHRGGDHNYGEGSSREHAAMQPRHLGVRAPCW